MQHVKNETEFNIRLVPAAEMNQWLMARHYLHRPMIRTKLLAHEIESGGKRIGGVLWSTPHFTKKKGLFGYEGTYDKWEVLVLSRFFIEEGCGVVASSVLSRSVGKRGKRIQNEWCSLHPPVFPENPFVPRLLMSWSDMGLQTVDCECGRRHIGNHRGVIYQASGWELFDVSNSSGRRTGKQNKEGEKRLWIRRLARNKNAEKIGISSAIQETGSLF